MKLLWCKKKIPNIAIPSTLNESKTVSYYYQKNCTYLNIDFREKNEKIIQKVEKFIVNRLTYVRVKKFNANMIGNHTFLNNELIINKLIKLL